MKRILLYFILLCVLTALVSCNRQPMDLSPQTDATNQSTPFKPEQDSGDGFPKQTINIGSKQVYDQIINTAPKSRGKLVTKDNKIFYIDSNYDIITCDYDGSNAVNIFSSDNYIYTLEIFGDSLFFIDDHKGLYSMADYNTNNLVSGSVGNFFICNNKLFFNLLDNNEKTNQLYMSDLDGTNIIMIANLDNRQNIDHIFKCPGELIGQKDQMIYYSVSEEYDYKYYHYDLTTNKSNKIDKEEIECFQETHNMVRINNIHFATQLNTNEKYTLCITDTQNGTVFTQINVSGDTIYLLNEHLYIFDASNNIEYFELK